LVYVTTGLVIIGLLQGYILQRSVRVADRAATEAKDAIAAAQTSAAAGKKHAEVAEMSLFQLEAPYAPTAAPSLSIPPSTQ
jgi:hypothetical protein